MLARWLLSLSPNVFLQFSSHCRVKKTGAGDAQRTEEKTFTFRGGKGGFFFPPSLVHLHLDLCVYNKGWSVGRFNKCVVLSELKKACSGAQGSIRPSRDHCCLIQLAPLHPRSLCNLISLLFPLPLPSSSHPLTASPAWPPLTGLGALWVISVPQQGMTGARHKRQLNVPRLNADETAWVSSYTASSACL